MKNVLYIVDDHNMVRIGLKTWLESHTSWNIKNDFASGKECFDFLRTLPSDSENFPELLIVDVQLENETGFGLVEDVTKNFPQIKVVMYSMYDTPGFVLQAKSCGAKGYISKVAKEEELANCLSIVQNGGFYMEDYMEQAQLKLDSVVKMLSKQEKNIFEAILQGKNNQQICDEFFISAHTVENYTSRIYDKINVKSREDLIKKYGK